MHMKRLCTERRTCLFYEVVQMGKYLSRSHMSYEVMDTRHTIEVNIVKSSSCYAGVTSPKTKQILGSQRLSPRTWKT